MLKKEEIVISSFNIKNTMSIKENEVMFSENGISVNGLIPEEINDSEFNILMSVYKRASEQVLKMLNGVEVEYSKIFNHNIINHTTSRIKGYNSIINKMKKKNLELNYENLVENINDIAGVRVVCPIKDDVYTIANIIKKVPNWNFISEKDYIKNPKKSGYSGYHVIVEVPVKVSNINNMGKKNCKAENSTESKNVGRQNKLLVPMKRWYMGNLNNFSIKDYIFVKVEIQIRTMAMDFWATNEHKLKYKGDKKLSIFDSKKLAVYARVLSILDDRFAKISKKQRQRV